MNDTSHFLAIHQSNNYVGEAVFGIFTNVEEAIAVCDEHRTPTFSWDGMEPEVQEWQGSRHLRTWEWSETNGWTENPHE